MQFSYYLTHTDFNIFIFNISSDTLPSSNLTLIIYSMNQGLWLRPRDPTLSYTLAVLYTHIHEQQPSSQQSSQVRPLPEAQQPSPLLPSQSPQHHDNSNNSDTTISATDLLYAHLRLQHPSCCISRFTAHPFYIWNIELSITLFIDSRPYKHLTGPYKQIPRSCPVNQYPRSPLLPHHLLSEKWGNTSTVEKGSEARRKYQYHRIIITVCVSGIDEACDSFARVSKKPKTEAEGRGGDSFTCNIKNTKVGLL